MKKILQTNKKLIHAKQRKSYNVIFEFNQKSKLFTLIFISSFKTMRTNFKTQKSMFIQTKHIYETNSRFF